MSFAKKISKVLPRTYNKIGKLRKENKKFLAACSLGCLFGFIAFIPAIVTFDKLLTNPQMAALIGVGYLVAFFFLTIFGVVADKMGIAKELFKDYSNMGPHFHLSIIVGSVGGVLALAWAKIYAILYLQPNDKPKGN